MESPKIPVRAASAGNCASMQDLRELPPIMAQTTYQAPLELMQLALRQAAESTGAVGIDGYAEVLADLAPPVLENAARFAGEVLSPLTGGVDVFVLERSIP